MHSVKLGKRVLYNLKKRFGSPADLYHQISFINDPKTGTSSVVKQKYHIRRVILLPTTMNSVVALQGEYRRVDSRFPSITMDINSRLIIVDKKDLPENVVLGDKDYFIILSHRNVPGKRFNIQKAIQLEDDNGILISTIFIEGGVRNEEYDLKIKEKLILSETLSNA